MTRSVFYELRQLPQGSFRVCDGVSESLDSEAVLQRAATLAAGLLAGGATIVALHADNGIDWIIADLACDQAGIGIVPIPPFFSADQIAAVMADSGVDTLLTDRSAWFRSNFDGVGSASPAPGAASLEICPAAGGGAGAAPEGTRKITYTSGTTGNPKGVCLSAAHQLTVAESLIAVTRLTSPRHLCTLPLATLLENIAGVYGPLLAGGTVIVPSLASLGFNGSSKLDLPRFLQMISDVRPDSLILVPETLKMLVVAVHRGWRAPDSLKFVAVGGGKVANTLIREARACGLPVYEGYGLSECGSVVSLNTGHDDLPGSVGKPLPHVGVSIDDAEIVIAGASCLGYVGDPESWGQATIRTGDIGHVDADGRLFIDGRRKNVLITSFGRNISPEWVESEMLAGDSLRHAWVFGDAAPYCVAFVVAASPAITDDNIEAWIARVNSRLPDYARIAKWHRVDTAVGDISALLTANGRPRRDRIRQRFQPVLDAMYQPNSKESAL